MLEKLNNQEKIINYKKLGFRGVIIKTMILPILVL